MIIAGAFIAGLAWSDRAWEKRWAERDSAESSQEVNAQTAARMIEQGRLIARDEAVKMLKRKQLQRVLLPLISLILLASCGSRQKLATRLDAASHTASLAATVRSKTTGATAGVLADMLGNLAEEARRYAAIADERYTAGMTCERIYESVRTSIPSKG